MMKHFIVAKSQREMILENVNHIDSWVEVIEISPVDLSRVYSYAQDFSANIAVPIMPKTLEYAKRKLFDARNSLDLMITTLIQILYDDKILSKSEDRVLFGWLKDDLGRFMQSLDESETDNIVTLDNPNSEFSKVGVSRLSAYSKEMKNAYKSLYEALIKTMKEYYTFEEEDEIKREPRTFLYILFHVFGITMSVLGSITRKPNSPQGKRGTVSLYPTTWQNMMSTSGRDEIRKSFKDETGQDLPISMPSGFLDETVQLDNQNQDQEENFGGELDEPNY